MGVQSRRAECGRAQTRRFWNRSRPGATQLVFGILVVVKTRRAAVQTRASEASVAIDVTVLEKREKMRVALHIRLRETSVRLLLP